jgi:DNA-binding CsgD family transcriptional regulator
MGDRALLAAYDAVVSDIYEAALSPSHWDVALTSLISHFSPPRWDVAMLVWERLHPATGRFIGAAGVNDFARAGYISMFAGRQAWSVAGHAIPVGQVMHSDEIVGRETFKQGDFYKSFLTNWGIEIAILASLDRHGQDHLGLCMPGHEGYDTAALKDVVTRLVPHFQRATRIGRRLGEADLRAANAEAALDASPSIILSVGADLSLLHANNAAQAWLAETQDVFVREGRLRFADAGMQARLVALANGSAHTRTESLQAGDADALTHLVAMRTDSARGDMAVLLVGGQRRQISEVVIERLRGWFDFTPSEAKLAVYIAEGQTLEDYARDRGVSVNAARFLLKGIFGKAGVGRQAEFVAMLRDAPLAWQNPIQN